jgi:hypothetical protein
MGTPESWKIRETDRGAFPLSARERRVRDCE